MERVKIALQDLPEGYTRAGDLFVSMAKLDEIARKLAGVAKLTDALYIIEVSELKDDACRALEDPSVAPCHDRFSTGIAEVLVGHHEQPTVFGIRRSQLQDRR